MTEHFPLIEINVGDRTKAVTFTANGEYLVSGNNEGIRVWGVEDGERMAEMAAWDVRCLAVSKDDRWVAAGTAWGETIVWDTDTFEKAFTLKEENDVTGVDLSPDATRLVIASADRTAAVWDVTTCKRVLGPLRHEGWVRAAKYSPQGDRIATAAYESVRIYDGSDGRLLVNIPIKVTPWHNTGLVWSSDQLFIVSDGKIRQIEASTGSAVSEWPVLDTNRFSCIALVPQHGEFIAYSTNSTVTFWDTSTHTQLSLIQHPQSIRTTALSPDDRFLAIGGEDGKITIKSLPCIVVPFIHITDTALDSWKQARLVDTEASLTATITNSGHSSRHALANRALVRAHLRRWDGAIDDAEKSIKIQPSVIGYIAKSVALIGGGNKSEGCQVFDFAFRHCHPNDVDLLRLIKAVVLFIAGEHDDAVSRAGDLVATVHFGSTCRMVQAYMLLLLGSSHMERSNYEGAIQSFERARAQMRFHMGHRLLAISLISGWKFNDLGITIQQRLCEALYAAGRTREGGESLLNLVNTLEEEAYTDGPIAKWVSDFTQRCLSVPKSDGDVASKAPRHGEAAMLHATLSLRTLSSLLREWAKSTLASVGWKDALVAAVSFTTPRFMIYYVICDHLEMTNRLTDAVECFHQTNSELVGESNNRGEQARWAVDFKRRCAEKLEHLGDAAADARQHDDAITQYSAALSLSPASQDIFIKRSKMYVAKELWENALNDTNQVIMLEPLSPWSYDMVLREWAKVKLADGSWRNALKIAGGLKVPRFTLYRALCERLETVDRVRDATECFHEMASELVQEPGGEQAKWILDFKSRCCGKLVGLGDIAMNARQYDEAISQYSVALSLNPTPPDLVLFVKRSKARAAKGLWKDALNDANEVIELDASSPLGYERKHTASHGAGYYSDAMHALEMMLLKMSLSPDPDIRVRSREYVNPAETKARIHAAIEDAIRESPLVLINTDTGRLLDKSGQACSFESQPIFAELVSSMTARIDQDRIEHEVAQYYRYAMFSHRWEGNEPLFDKVIHIVVYDLEESLTHDKLQMFCKVVRDAGLRWAWSDTCCINKGDHFVLQEALVSMFKWYQGSAVTIVFLRGVRFPSKRGALVKSIWNTRAWTFQEYHASKVVRFYTEDWKPYMNLDMFNHKESPEIISEMEEATGVSARALMALQPGLDDIREKLRLASTRQTTRVEDAAYSLLGIFSVSLPAIYGEGEKSLGRLLAQLLTSSGDTSILAWTGRSGRFNSCLPADITAFTELPTSHTPQPIEGAQMETTTARLRTSLLNLTLVTKFYDRLDELSVPSLLGQRMKLPCIMFKLGPLSASRSKSGHVFRAQTAALGIVEIKTKEDLNRLDSLYLIHPWIDFLLNRQPVGSVTEIISEEVILDDQASSIGELLSFSSPFNSTSAAPQTRTARLVARFGRPFGGRPTTVLADMMSLRPPSSVSQTDKQIRALRTLARVRQPFGALLLTPHLGNVSAYKRVAAESLITVQVEEITPIVLNKLMEGVRMLDVL